MHYIVHYIAGSMNVVSLDLFDKEKMKAKEKKKAERERERDEEKKENIVCA